MPNQEIKTVGFMAVVCVVCINYCCYPRICRLRGGRSDGGGSFDHRAAQPLVLFAYALVFLAHAMVLLLECCDTGPYAV